MEHRYIWTSRNPWLVVCCTSNLYGQFWLKIEFISMLNLSRCSRTCNPTFGGWGKILCCNSILMWLRVLDLSSCRTELDLTRNESIITYQKYTHSSLFHWTLECYLRFKFNFLPSLCLRQGKKMPSKSWRWVLCSTIPPTLEWSMTLTEKVPR